MNNSVRVKIFESIDNLHGVAFHFQLMQSLPSFQQFVHTLVVTQLEKNVYIFTIFEKVHELGYILMLDRSMNFDFAH